MLPRHRKIAMIGVNRKNQRGLRAAALASQHFLLSSEVL